MKGKLTIKIPHHFDDNDVEITLCDSISSTTVCTIKLDGKEFLRCLGRLANTPCEVSYGLLDRVGRALELDTLVFPMDEKAKWSEKEDVARKLAEEHCPDGWVCDHYYSKQGSFFWKDGKYYGKTTIRRWVALQQCTEEKHLT